MSERAYKDSMPVPGAECSDRQRSALDTLNRDRFVKFIRAYSPASPLLPAVQITNVDAFGKIASTGVMNLNESGKLYFFYGKPSYRLPKASSMPTKVLGDAAVCFVFDLSTLPDLHKVYSFDTGGFFAQRYDDYLPTGVAMADFELAPEHQILAQTVAAFFGSNRNYYAGTVKAGLTIPALDRASEVYAGLIRSSVSEHFDERVCTCELQFDRSISVPNVSLLTIVLPDVLYDDLEVQEILARWRIKPVLYKFKRSRPDERTEVIYDKLGDFYQATKMI